eukprot:m.279445 g.279445  ORF g.279445 m.279445 type:complete len:306 (-) comp19805_c0_seq11:562-1479(-)
MSNMSSSTGAEAHTFISEKGIHQFMGFGMCLAFLFVYDVVFAYQTPGRWFNVHAMANLITVIFCSPAVVAWAKDPLSVVSPEEYGNSPDPLGENWLDWNVLFHPCNDWSILMIVAVHTYHCVAFKLSKQDIFHHFMFVPTIGVYGGFLVSWGPIRNCLPFFISGLPGGIDYAMLVLLKRGMTTKLTCKKLSSTLNVWLRGPGCGVLVPATIYAAYCEGRLPQEQAFKCMILAGFAAYNGLHYMEMAVMNYQMHLTRTLLEKDHSAEMTKMKEYWTAQEGRTKQIPTAFDIPVLMKSSSHGNLEDL